MSQNKFYPLRVVSLSTCHSNTKLTNTGFEARSVQLTGVLVGGHLVVEKGNWSSLQLLPGEEDKGRLGQTPRSVLEMQAVNQASGGRHWGAMAGVGQKHARVRAAGWDGHPASPSHWSKRMDSTEVTRVQVTRKWHRAL